MAKKPLEPRPDSTIARAALKEIGKQIRDEKEILCNICMASPWGKEEIIGVSGRIQGLEQARDILTAKLKKGGKK